MNIGKMAIIVLGRRGISLLENTYLEHKGIDFAAICDICEDRIKRAADLIERRNGKTTGL